MLANGVVYAANDEQVYAASRRNRESRSHSFAAEDGSEVWSVATGREVQAAPTVVDGVVYFGNDDGQVFALDAASGHVE